jgi:hypothetical protein
MQRPSRGRMGMQLRAMQVIIWVLKSLRSWTGFILMVFSLWVGNAEGMASSFFAMGKL